MASNGDESMYIDITPYQTKESKGKKRNEKKID
jgi:hypothetical protein